MKTLGDASNGRDNNFNLIRMIAAWSVLISHSWPLAWGFGTPEPLSGLIGFPLGTTAVVVFFAISGFFITQSFDRSASLLDFTIARVLRIFPALIITLLLIVMIMGPLMTNLSLWEYFTHIETITYIPRNASLISLQGGLPGVFAANPYGNAINGSLWTLLYEVSCYVGLAILGVAGALEKGRFKYFLIVFLIAQLYLTIFPSDWPVIKHLSRLSLAFFIGVSFYVFRHRIPLHWAVIPILLVMTYLLWSTFLRQPMFLLTLSYSCFWFGHLAWWGRAAYNRLGDYSYGMYIYAFPVQQTVVALNPGISPMGVIIPSTIATLLLAMLSWYIVEKPALSRRRDAASFLTIIGRMSSSRI